MCVSSSGLLTGPSVGFQHLKAPLWLINILWWHLGWTRLYLFFFLSLSNLIASVKWWPTPFLHPAGLKTHTNTIFLLKTYNRGRMHIYLLKEKNRLSSTTAFMVNFLPDLPHISKNIPWIFLEYFWFVIQNICYSFICHSLSCPMGFVILLSQNNAFRFLVFKAVGSS